jgi:photosystem II stability/assembly factor-like uncharacterized protein
MKVRFWVSLMAMWCIAMVSNAHWRGTVKAQPVVAAAQGPKTMTTKNDPSRGRRQTAQAQVSASALAQFNWVPLGPRGVVQPLPPPTPALVYTGRVRAIAVHPTNPNVVYVGAASGGIWKTTDGGSSWTDLTMMFPTCTFGAISIDPENPSIVYAGTGEVTAEWLFNIYNGRGLFKSTDGGNSWTQIGSEFGPITHFGGIAVSPHDSQIVFAALAGGYVHTRRILTNTGVWRSTNAGKTWTHTLTVAYPECGGYDVIVHPTDSNRVYAAVGGLYPCTEYGFYISTDNGVHWTKSNSGLPSGMLRMQIALSGSAPSTIYALIYTYNADPYMTKLFKSTDDGRTWNKIAGTYEFGAGGRDQGHYDLCIAADPADQRHVLVGNVELSISTDGENFSYYSPPTMHVDFHKIVFAPSDRRCIYVGNDGGVYRSTDGGGTWQEKNQWLTTLQLYGMSSHPTNKNIIIAGSQDNHTFGTNDHGATPWDLSMFGGPGGDVQGVFFDPVTPDTLYFTPFRNSLVRVTNGGRTTKRIDANFGSMQLSQKNFLIHPSNHLWLYAPSTKIWRSTNAGETWTALTSDLSTWPIEAMAQSCINPDIMILATTSVEGMNVMPEVKLSTDGGSAWSDVTTNIPDEQRYIARVVTHPTRERTLFIVRSGFGSGKIYRSTNLGSTWENVTGNLPDIPHSDLFIDPLYTNRYFVANDYGVYVSQDSGSTWVRFGNGMPYVPATDLDYFSPSGERLLRVATYGRGVFEADLHQMDVNHTPVVAHPIPDKTVPKNSGTVVLSGNLHNVFSDVDDDSLTFSAKSDNTKLSISVSHDSLLASSAYNYFGDAQVVVTATDPFAASATDTVQLRIENVNHPPSAFALIAPPDGDTTQTVNTPIGFRWRAAIDPDDDTLHYTLRIASSGKDTSFSGILDTTFNFDGRGYLRDNTTYTWGVTAKDSYDASTSSTSFRFTVRNVVSVRIDQRQIPDHFALEQNFPNPVNPSTIIKYQIPHTARIILKVFDLLGQHVVTLVDEVQEAGYKSVEFDGSHLASGVYIYRLQAGDFLQTRKLLILK